MKKGILFAGGVALTLAFAGCDDGSAKIAELQAELDAAKVKSDSLSLAASAQLDELTTTFQYKVDSLQYVIDSLTAPKGTTVTKPKPKPAPTTPTEPTKTEPTGNTNSTRGGTTGSTSGGTNTNTSRGGTSNTTDSTKVNTNTSRGGTKTP